jgi:hypothetical protein
LNISSPSSSKNWIDEIMRKSFIYMICMTIGLTLMGGLLFLYPIFAGEARQKSLNESKGLVKELRLTDLCLFTEARYTRHPSQADIHSAFQDHPMALEHFPSGSLILPPHFFHSRVPEETQ